MKSICVAFRCLLLLLIFGAFSCTPGATELYTPKELSKLLHDAGGWALLPFPDSKYEPGSIVRITPENGIRWIGSAQSCGISPEVLRPVPGDVPPLNLSKKTTFSGSLAVKYQGIEVGPEYAKVKNVVLKINKMTSSGIDLIKLSNWLNDPANHATFSATCTEYLTPADQYFQNEGLSISDGSFTLYDKDDKKLSLTAANLGQYFGGSLKASLSVETDGSVTFDKPYFLAIRTAHRKGNVFETLGPSRETTPPSAGDQILVTLSEKY